MCRQLNKIRHYLFNTLAHHFKKSVYLKVSVTEIYPRIPWVHVAGPLAIAEHTSGMTALNYLTNAENRETLISGRRIDK